MSPPPTASLVVMVLLLRGTFGDSRLPGVSMEPYHSNSDTFLSSSTRSETSSFDQLPTDPPVSTTVHLHNLNNASPWKDGQQWQQRKYSARSRGMEKDSPILDLSYLPPLRTPIVYRYYPRQKSRTLTAGSIPFVLLGPNVDHWKVVGQQLSARGFNVIAVGPNEPRESGAATASQPPTSKTPDDQDEERYVQGPALLWQLLDSLRWNQVVLVGCDKEAAWAIEAALHLAPHRIAGLVLCGPLEECERIFINAPGVPKSNRPLLELDRFLHERLACPFTIVWDGTLEERKPIVTSSLYSNNDASSLLFSTPPAAAIMNAQHRSVMIGGGTAPHRRRPGIFAWILTRFVEEHLAPPVPDLQSSSIRTARSRRPKEATPKAALLPLWFSSSPIWRFTSSRIPVLWSVDDMFNEESMVVFGRIVATAIFYAISLKVIFYQYGNVRDLIDMILSTHRSIVTTMNDRVSHVGSLILRVARLPFLCAAWFWNRTESSVPLKGIDEPENDAADKSEDSRDKKDEEEDNDEKEPLEKNVRPFFFLDHVVA
jgi:hypothetical protein